MSFFYNLVVGSKNLLLNKNKKLIRKIKLLVVAIKQYYIFFNIVRIASSNFVLQIFSLKIYNLDLNLKKQSLCYKNIIA